MSQFFKFKLEILLLGSTAKCNKDDKYSTHRIPICEHRKICGSTEPCIPETEYQYATANIDRRLHQMIKVTWSHGLGAEPTASLARSVWTFTNVIVLYDRTRF